MGSALDGAVRTLRAPEELQGIRQSPELQGFLADMDELVAASEQNGNSIVFV
jgi:hypothetical protein